MPRLSPKLDIQKIPRDNIKHAQLMASLRYEDEKVEEVTNNGGHLDICVRLGDCRELDS